MFRYFLLLSISLILVAGCGPSQTARDEEQAQEDATNAAQKAMNDLVAGTYRGSFTANPGQYQAIELVITSVETIQNVPTNGSVNEIPELNGDLFFLNSINSPGGVSMVTYSSGTYNQGIGRLQMSNGTGLVAGFSVDLLVQGGHLTGNYGSPTWVTNTVDLNKVQ